jgi:hypothetical protein
LDAASIFPGGYRPVQRGKATGAGQKRQAELQQRAALIGAGSPTFPAYSITSSTPSDVSHPVKSIPKTNIPTINFKYFIFGAPFCV